MRLRAPRAGSGTGIDGEQRLRVGMARLGEQRALVGQLDDLAEVHHRDAVAMCFTTARSWAMKT